MLFKWTSSFGLPTDYKWGFASIFSVTQWDSLLDSPVIETSGQYMDLSHVSSCDLDHVGLFPSFCCVVVSLHLVTHIYTHRSLVCVCPWSFSLLSLCVSHLWLGVFLVFTRNPDLCASLFLWPTSRRDIFSVKTSWRSLVERTTEWRIFGEPWKRRRCLRKNLRKRLRSRLLMKSWLKIWLIIVKFSLKPSNCEHPWTVRPTSSLPLTKSQTMFQISKRMIIASSGKPRWVSLVVCQWNRKCWTYESVESMVLRSFQHSSKVSIKMSKHGPVMLDSFTSIRNMAIVIQRGAELVKNE